jgi:two-component system, cell cycle sensor histidine kinase and response regulator CckA
VILTDVIMPQMSGRELSERISAFHPEIKTVFMSGYSSNLLGDRSVSDPEYVLLQKPVRLTTLGTTIRDIVNRIPQAAKK